MTQKKPTIEEIAELPVTGICWDADPALEFAVAEEFEIDCNAGQYFSEKRLKRLRDHFKTKPTKFRVYGGPSKNPFELYVQFQDKEVLLYYRVDSIGPHNTSSRFVKGEIPDLY